MTDTMDHYAHLDRAAFGPSSVLEMNEAGDEQGGEQPATIAPVTAHVHGGRRQYRCGTSVPRHLVPSGCLRTARSGRRRPVAAFSAPAVVRAAAAHGVAHGVSRQVGHPVRTDSPIHGRLRRHGRNGSGKRPRAPIARTAGP
jgi:hypothetical protein